MAARIQTIPAAWAFLPLLCAPLLGAGPAGASVDRHSGALQTAFQSPPAPSPATEDLETMRTRLQDHPLILGLRPFENRPGVFVCEPVSGQSAEQAMVDFGAGCARWLELVVGGQPELDRSPRWTEAQEVQRELKKSDLRIEPGQAATFARVTGVTYLALGELRTQGPALSLSYRVFRMPERRPVGKLLMVSGYPQQVTAQLPQLAKELAYLCGACSPRVPVGVGETADELAKLGALPWMLPRTLDDPTREAVYALASRRWQGNARESAPPVLAGLMGMMLSGVRGETVPRNPAALALLRALPGNTMVLSTAAEYGYAAGDPEHDPVRDTLDQALARYPRNYQLHCASASNFEFRNRQVEARQAAEEAVRCHTGDPGAWLLLERMIQRQATAIRQARTINLLTEQERIESKRFYLERLPVLLMAANLNEASLDTWRTLSAAAAFAGARTVARDAFQQAFTMDPKDQGVVWWGLELFQPKWQNQPVKLRLVAEAAVAAAEGWWKEARVEVAITLRHCGFLTLWDQVTRDEVERGEVEAYFRAHPEWEPLRPK